MPALSALMVFHRDTPHLRSAVESVLNQTWRDLELVLVDNGTGLTADALGGAGRDPRLRWVRLARNEGIPSGHNAGLAVAAGEFIALLDYDDMAQPQRFERQIALLRSEPAVGLVSSLVDTIDETGTVVGREFSIVSGEAQRTYSAFAAPVVTPAYLGRRSVFARFPFRPEFSLAADFDFLARAAEVCEFAAVPEVLLHYRRYSGQTSESRKDVMEANWCAIRVATARRRRGRPEFLADILPQMDAQVSAAESCRRWATRNLAEGLFPLAAYHARRATTLRPSLVGFGAATAMAAIRRSRGAERRLAARLYLTGPVRALGIIRS